MAGSGARLALIGAVVEREVTAHSLVEDDAHLLVHRPVEKQPRLLCEPGDQIAGHAMVADVVTPDTFGSSKSLTHTLSLATADERRADAAISSAWPPRQGEEGASRQIK